MQTFLPFPDFKQSARVLDNKRLGKQRFAQHTTYAGNLPNWLTEDFCRAHQSNLLRKDEQHYRKYFPNVPDNLPYIWPL